MSRIATNKRLICVKAESKNYVTNNFQRSAASVNKRQT